MTTTGIQSSAFQQAPKLRLLPTRGDATATADTGSRPELRLLDGPKAQGQPVLIAGGDAATREAVLRDFVETMAPSTTFEHAEAIWQVLARAPEASMVILSGELEGIPAKSLMQMLVHKAPDVAVVCLDVVDAAAPFAQCAAAASR